MNYFGLFFSFMIPGVVIGTMGGVRRKGSGSQKKQASGYDAAQSHAYRPQE